MCNVDDGNSELASTTKKRRVSRIVTIVFGSLVTIAAVIVVADYAYKRLISENPSKYVDRLSKKVRRSEHVEVWGWFTDLRDPLSPKHFEVKASLDDAVEISRFAEIFDGLHGSVNVRRTESRRRGNAEANNLLGRLTLQNVAGTEHIRIEYETIVAPDDTVFDAPDFDINEIPIILRELRKIP